MVLFAVACFFFWWLGNSLPCWFTNVERRFTSKSYQKIARDFCWMWTRWYLRGIRSKWGIRSSRTLILVTGFRFHMFSWTKWCFLARIHPEMRGHHEQKYQCLIVYRFLPKDRLQILKADLNSDRELRQNSRMLVTGGCQTEKLRSPHSVVDSLTAVDVLSLPWPKVCYNCYNRSCPETSCCTEFFPSGKL